MNNELILSQFWLFFLEVSKLLYTLIKEKQNHTATFIKRVFAHALRDIKVSTIDRKMSHTESECRIKLDGKYDGI